MGSLNKMAQELGCSASTISRVLNGYTHGFSVRPELQERILETAKRSGYKPNPFWRTMRAKRTNLVAMLDTPYNNRLEDAENGKMRFIETIRKAGLTESLKYVERDSPEDHKVAFPVDAALLFDIGDKSCLNYFESEKVPYAVINGLCGPNGVSLLVDEMNGMKLLLEHLLSLGHRRIAYANSTYTGYLTVHYSETLRERHYLELLASHGLSPLPEHWNKQISPRDFVERALDNGATAVVCYHHEKAMEIMHAAWELGIPLPERLSVVCFNNDKTMASFIPPITCVSAPLMEMGIAAADKLLKILDGSLCPSGQTYKFSGRLIVRKSAAKPFKAEDVL